MYVQPQKNASEMRRSIESEGFDPIPTRTQQARDGQCNPVNGGP